jgi:transcriptional accessory protein Tex/SPT6
MKPISLCIAEELGVREQQVAAAISLLDGGATVPFVARYRKESTGALDDAQLGTLEERLRYLRELDERRATSNTSLLGNLIGGNPDSNFPIFSVRGVYPAATMTVTF